MAKKKKANTHKSIATQEKQKKASQNKRGYNPKPPVYLLCFLFVISSLTFFNLTLYFSSQRPSTRTVNADVVYDTTYWESLLNDHPDYFPGWIELAKLEYANGRMDLASIALSNARKINPNSQELKTLEYLLSLNQ